MATNVAKAKAPPPMTDQEIQQRYSNLQSDIQALVGKISELEAEAEEHSLVLETLNDVLKTEPDRKCFRMVGGVLAERTVKEVVPALQMNIEGIQRAVSGLAEQYKGREETLETFKRDYNIRVVSRS